MTNGSNKVGTIGLGIAIIAIIMSGVALAMLTGVSKIQQKTMEVGAPGNAPSEFYIFTQELNVDEEKLGVPVAVYILLQRSRFTRETK